MTTLVSPARSARIPNVALWLGSAGLVPFVAGALLAWAAPQILGISATRLVIGYAAVILSFLGGMTWGLSSAALARDAFDLDAPKLLAASVVPSLIAWTCLFLPDLAALLALAAAFALALSLDRTLLRVGFAPAWWMKLRYRLSLVVVIALLVTALSLLAH